MQSLLFQTSSSLAVSGIASVGYGLFAEQAKLLVLGFVLVLGAGVFATLYLGTRKASQKSDQNELQG
jgi:hypothetical protein